MTALKQFFEDQMSWLQLKARDEFNKTHVSLGPVFRKPIQNAVCVRHWSIPVTTIGHHLGMLMHRVYLLILTRSSDISASGIAMYDRRLSIRSSSGMPSVSIVLISFVSCNKHSQYIRYEGGEFLSCY